jgi:hypothetical protein
MAQNLAGEEFASLRHEFESRLERLALGDLQEQPATVVSKMKAFIKSRMEEDYIPTLRNKSTDFLEVQYARGALDALEGLLALLEEHQ